MLYSDNELYIIVCTDIVIDVCVPGEGGRCLCLNVCLLPW